MDCGLFFGLPAAPTAVRTAITRPPGILTAACPLTLQQKKRFSSSLTNLIFPASRFPEGIRFMRPTGRKSGIWLHYRFCFHLIFAVQHRCRTIFLTQCLLYINHPLIRASFPMQRGNGAWACGQRRARKYRQTITHVINRCSKCAFHENEARPASYR